MHKTFLGVCMGLIWLSYFYARKDNERVWWRGGDLTETRMKRPFNGRLRSASLKSTLAVLSIELIVRYSI